MNKGKNCLLTILALLRERDALLLMSENLSNQEIADKLFISLNMVKTRLKGLYIKLDVDSRSKAVEKAREIRLTLTFSKEKYTKPTISLLAFKHRTNICSCNL